MRQRIIGVPNLNVCFSQKRPVRSQENHENEGQETAKSGQIVSLEYGYSLEGQGIVAHCQDPPNLKRRRNSKSEPMMTRPRRPHENNKQAERKKSKGVHDSKRQFDRKTADQYPIHTCTDENPDRTKAEYSSPYAEVVFLNATGMSHWRMYQRASSDQGQIADD